MSGHSPVGTFHLVPGSVPTGVRSPGAYIQAMWFEVSMLKARTRAEAPLWPLEFLPTVQLYWGMKEDRFGSALSETSKINSSAAMKKSEGQG